MRTLLETEPAAAAAGVSLATDPPTGSETTGAAPPPSSTSPSPPSPRSPSTPSSTSPPPRSSSSPPPPALSPPAPPPLSPLSPPPLVSVSPPPPVSASPPPPAPSSHPPPPATLPPPPPAPVPASSPPPPTATAPPPPDDAAPPPPSVQAQPPSGPPPPSPSTSPSGAPPPATVEPATPPEDVTPPPPYAAEPPPPRTRGSSSATVRSPPAAAALTPPAAGYSAPSPPSSSGLSAGATAAVAVVAVLAFLSCAGVFVCFSRRRKRKRADWYYPGSAVHSPYAAQHVSGEAPFLRSPSAPTSVNFSMGGQGTMASQAYGQNQRMAPSMNYSTGSQGPKSAATDISVGSTKAFVYDDLYDITGGFSPKNLLGEGGFGCVYKGTLADGKAVAVKQLKGGGGQGEREFQAEVEIISRVHHRHLVSLVGYCIDEDHRLLVYDFVSNNTLHHHLHGRGRPVMDWPTRVKIAAGSARGLAYLHEDCHPRIIHRDIKSSNILLDDNFEAQVADFGLARLAENDVTHVSTRVMGTFGYLAPEYASTGKLTEKSDVFSFGVMLLELITGRKPVDSSRPLGDESLVEWSRPLLNNAIENQEFDELVDPRLQTNYDEVEMFRVIEAAAACIRHSAARRPKMGQIVRVLDSLTDVDLSNGVQPGKSQMFNVASTVDIRQFQRMAFGSQDFSSENNHSKSSFGSRREF